MKTTDVHNLKILPIFKNHQVNTFGHLGDPETNYLQGKILLFRSNTYAHITCQILCCDFSYSIQMRVSTESISKKKKSFLLKNALLPRLHGLDGHRADRPSSSVFVKTAASDCQRCSSERRFQNDP